MDEPLPPPAGNGSSGGPAVVHQPLTLAERIHQLSEIDKDIASLLTHLSSAMRALGTPPDPAGVRATPDEDEDDDGEHRNGHASHAPLSSSSSSSDPISAFRAAQTAFVRAVDRIDKHLTRQILALEEEGIIALRNAAAGGGATAGGVGGGEQLLQSQHAGMGPAGAGAGPSGFQQQQQQAQQQLGAKDIAAGAWAAPARLEPDGMGRFGGLDVGQLNMASSTVERDMEAELWRRAREHLGQVVGQEADGDRMEE